MAIYLRFLNILLNEHVSLKYSATDVWFFGRNNCAKFQIALYENWLVKLFNPIQDGPFWVRSRMGGVKKAPLSKICHTCPTIKKLGTVIPYLKKTQKIYESRDTPLKFCWYQQFFIRNQQILLYQKKQI